MSATAVDSTSVPDESSGLERAVIRTVTAVFGLLAGAYDLLGAAHAWSEGGLVAAGRALSAIGLGWMCGWYFTVRFHPTSWVLRSSLATLTGHVVASITAINAWLVLAALDWLGARPDRASFVSLTAVTFAPVASFFATQISRDRAVHLVCGFGIGALSYVVLFGVPD